MAVYTFTHLLNDEQTTQRQAEIRTIRKLRKGDSFQPFKDKFILEENLINKDGQVMVTDEELRKIFIDYNFMDAAIKKLVSYCPNLFNVFTRNSRKREFIKNSLNDIEWKSILNEVYDGLEESADMFLEIYFENEEDTVPKLRVLDSLNMSRAILDDMNRYEQYVYKERIEDSKVIYSTGTVSDTNARDRIIVFEKGRKIVFDPQVTNGEIVRDEEGNIIYNVDEIPNRDSYANDFPLIHIKGYKKQRNEFSNLLSSHYIDPCLLLMQITSDLRSINRALGFPFIVIIDGIVNANSRRTPAGLFGVSTTDDAKGDGKQAKVQDVQISNDLKSVFQEFNIARDDLFEKVGLISPTLQQKLNVDSSRVIQQLNLPSENKIELYVDNIIKAMQLWFKILLKENDMYSERTDKNLSFIKPKFIIKSSPFDELLYEQSEIKSAKKSKEEIYIENGDLDRDITLRKEEINEELGDDNKDKSFATNEVSDRVSNGQNVDNNMINI